MNTLALVVAAPVVTVVALSPTVGIVAAVWSWWVVSIVTLVKNCSCKVELKLHKDVDDRVALES